MKKLKYNIDNVINIFKNQVYINQEILLFYYY